MDGVEVTGFVPDVRTYLAQTHVAVAPFSIAAGIQNKILEALAYRLPVVATSRTLRGLSAEVAAIVEAGDSPEELAAEIVRLLRGPEYARAKGAEGRRRVVAAYNWDRNLDRLLQLIENPFGQSASQVESHPSAVSRDSINPSRESRQDSIIQNKCSGARVLMLLTNAYDPDPRVQQEALALISLGCQVRILAWDRDAKAPAFEYQEGIEIERVFLRSKHGRGTTQAFFYAWVYVKILWRGYRTLFDTIHCHDLDTLPIGFVLGKLKHKPIVYDAHESFPDMLDGSVPRMVQGGLVRLENFLIRRIDLLITVGEKLRRHFAERGASRSTVVGNWKRLDEFSRTEEQNLAVRRRLGIPESATVVVCITQLLKDRKIEELLQALDECPDVYLIIGGRGVLEELVRQAAIRNPLIRYVGFVSGTEIPDYTCTSDVVYYGFDPENPNARFSAPNKLFEALAAGRPLITGDFGEIADVVRQASCGIVLPEYSAKTIQNALTTLHDSQVRSAMARNAKRFGEVAMNWENGEATLYREYSALVPNRLMWPPSGNRNSRPAPVRADAPSEVEVS
jgi:glycosyltransferase involved in cell wall biosynthesis